MIPILYDRYETEFTTNGLGRLADCVSCKVTEERNGVFECEFTYPMSGVRYEDIKEGRIIAVIHDDKKDIQPFEIYARTAPIDGLVTFYAHHISYRLGNVILRPGFYTSITEAFTRFPEDSYNDCPFTFWTDKSTAGRMTIEAPISIKAQLGGTAGSVLDVYGKGEYQWDKFNVKLYLNRGEDTDVEIRYGKNLTDMTHDVDLSETYTAVAPYWMDEKGGQIVTLPEGIILSEQVLTNLEDWTEENGEVMTDNRNNVLQFNSVYYKPVPMDLSEDFDTAPTAEQLRSKAQQHMNANQAWLPKENIKISFVALWQTEEYANIAPLQRVSLCDKVNVIHSRLGVRAEGVKVIKVVYNVLLERYDSMELGQPKTSFAEAVMASTETNILKIVPKKSAMDEAIEAATKLISGGLGGHVIFNTNADGKPNEILIMDTEDTETAVHVLRINENGIGFSHNGYNGPFDTAWTLDGHFVADYITTGNLDANLLTTGYIRDRQNRNYWNLESGEFRLAANTALGDKTINEILAEVDSTITAVDIEYNQNQSTSVAPAQDDPHWETNPPSWVAGYYIWQRTKTTTPGGVTYSAAVCISGRDGQSSTPGLNQATIYLYQRAQIKPAAIAVDMTYTFQSGVLSGIPDGWSREIPGGIFPCWVVSAPAIGTDATDTIYARDWSPVNKLVQDGTSLVSVTRYYAVSNDTEPPADKDFWTESVEVDWTTNTDAVITDNNGENIIFLPKGVPEPTEINKYVWAYDISKYDDGSTIQTEKYILSQYGRDGRGIAQLDEQYYLSTSKTALVGGEWLTNECPLWHTGTYIWTRSKITYDTGDIEYTEPVLAEGVNASNQTAQNALETANDAKERANNLDASLNQREIFNRLTHNGEQQGIYLQNGRLYLNATYMQTGTLNATLIAAGSITSDKIATGTLTVSQLSDATKKTLVKSSISKTQYCLANSYTTAPTSGWQDTVPTWSSGKYLWTRTATTVTYSDDDTESTSYSAAVYDKNLTTSLSTANTANTTANAANTTANTANTTANTAKSTADNAHLTANSAKSSAEEAHSKANTAVSTANTAKDTANSAASTANAARSTANSAQTTANDAIAREQTIYRSKPSGTTSLSGTTTWVTSTSNSQDSWTTTRPVYNRSYPVLFVATQRQTMAQKAAGSACSCTDPVIDQTTTIIDGGHITTGTIDAGVVNVTNINASNITSGSIDASKIRVTNLNADNITSGDISASMIKGGRLWLGGTGNVNGLLQMSDSGGAIIGKWDNTGITINKGSINIGNGVFKVSSTGELTATSATLSSISEPDPTLRNEIITISDGGISGNLTNTTYNWSIHSVLNDNYYTGMEIRSGYVIDIGIDQGASLLLVDKGAALAAENGGVNIGEGVSIWSNHSIDLSADKIYTTYKHETWTGCSCTVKRLMFGYNSSNGTWEYGDFVFINGLLVQKPSSSNIEDR